MDIRVLVVIIAGIQIFDVPDGHDCTRAASSDQFNTRGMYTVRDLMLAGF